jgi:hypothetical protein
VWCCSQTQRSWVLDFFDIFYENKRLTRSVVGCCNVAVAQINYPSFKHNTQDSIEQVRGRSHKEGSSQFFMLDDMQLVGGRYLG